MPENLENSAVATGLENISFHSNPKERQCQRMFKLLDNCTHFTSQKGNAQNPSVVHEPRTSICTSWVSKKQRSQKSNCQHSLDHGESKGILEKYLTSDKASDCVDHSKLTSFYISCGASPVQLNSPCFHLYKNEFIFPQF